jgi:hypothetical protein
VKPSEVIRFVAVLMLSELAGADPAVTVCAVRLP